MSGKYLNEMDCIGVNPWNLWSTFHSFGLLRPYCKGPYFAGSVSSFSRKTPSSVIFACSCNQVEQREGRSSHTGRQRDLFSLIQTSWKDKKSSGNSIYVKCIENPLITTNLLLAFACLSAEHETPIPTGQEAPRKLQTSRDFEEASHLLPKQYNRTAWIKAWALAPWRGSRTTLTSCKKYLDCKCRDEPCTGPCASLVSSQNWNALHQNWESMGAHLPPNWAPIPSSCHGSQMILAQP